MTKHYRAGLISLIFKATASAYFARGQGVSTYTHVSDQHSTFDTKVIVATAPESHYVLDGLLGNETDLPIFEHATDTHGATLANFALFDLVGKQLSPRIRDLGKITLYRTGPTADFLDQYPRAGPLLTRRLNTDLITAMWDDLLRVAAVGAGRARHRRPGRREAVLVQAAAERADQRDHCKNFHRHAVEAPPPTLRAARQSGRRHHPHHRFSQLSGEPRSTSDQLRDRNILQHLRIEIFTIGVSTDIYMRSITPDPGGRLDPIAPR